MFKSRRSGVSIFEVACVRGFNLLLTAEVLKEDLGIDNLNIYGIEYVQSSVDIAKIYLDPSAPVSFESHENLESFDFESCSYDKSLSSKAFS